MHGGGYLKLGEIRVNLPTHQYKHVIQLVSDEGDKLNDVRGRSRVSSVLAESFVSI